jgi:hypothetical protein
LNPQYVLAAGQADPALAHPLKAPQRSRAGHAHQSRDIDAVDFNVEATGRGHAADQSLDAIGSGLRNVNRVPQPLARLEVGDHKSERAGDDVYALRGPVGTALIARCKVVIGNPFTGSIKILGLA